MWVFQEVSSVSGVESGGTSSAGFAVPGGSTGPERSEGEYRQPVGTFYGSVLFYRFPLQFDDAIIFIARDTHEIVNGTSLREAMGLPPTTSPAPTEAAFGGQGQTYHVETGEADRAEWAGATLNRPAPFRALETAEEAVIRLELELAQEREAGRSVARHLQAAVDQITEGVGVIHSILQQLGLRVGNAPSEDKDQDELFPTGLDELSATGSGGRTNRQELNRSPTLKTKRPEESVQGRKRATSKVQQKKQAMVNITSLLSSPFSLIVFLVLWRRHPLGFRLEAGQRPVWPIQLPTVWRERLHLEGPGCHAATIRGMPGLRRSMGDILCPGRLQGSVSSRGHRGSTVEAESMAQGS